MRTSSIVRLSTAPPSTPSKENGRSRRTGGSSASHAGRRSLKRAMDDDIPALAPRQHVAAPIVIRRGARKAPRRETAREGGRRHGELREALPPGRVTDEVLVAAQAGKDGVAPDAGGEGEERMVGMVQIVARTLAPVAVAAELDLKGHAPEIGQGEKHPERVGEPPPAARRQRPVARPGTDQLARGLDRLARQQARPAPNRERTGRTHRASPRCRAFPPRRARRGCRHWPPPPPHRSACGKSQRGGAREQGRAKAAAGRSAGDPDPKLVVRHAGPSVAALPVLALPVVPEVERFHEEIERARRPGTGRAGAVEHQP